MRFNTDKNLKAVIALIREMVKRGTMEPGHKDEVEKTVMALRKAHRNHDKEGVSIAIGRLAALFLRMND